MSAVFPTSLPPVKCDARRRQEDRRESRTHCRGRPRGCTPGRRIPASPVRPQSRYVPPPDPLGYAPGRRAARTDSGQTHDRRSVRLAERSRIERVLQDTLDALVGAFAGWTAGYQLGFSLSLPAYIDAAAGLSLAVAALVLVLRSRRSESYPLDEGVRRCSRERQRDPLGSRDSGRFARRTAPQEPQGTPGGSGELLLHRAAPEAHLVAEVARDVLTCRGPCTRLSPRPPATKRKAHALLGGEYSRTVAAPHNVGRVAGDPAVVADARTLTHAARGEQSVLAHEAGHTPATLRRAQTLRCPSPKKGEPSRSSAIMA